MKKLHLILFIFLVFTSTLWAQNKDEDYLRIEKMTQDCIDNHPSTQGMAECMLQEQKEWDKVLNKYYNLLKAELSEEGQTALLNAQREWIKMRDKEFAFIDRFYFGEMSGTMYIPIAQSAKSEVIQKRALSLKSYYQELVGEGDY